MAELKTKSNDGDVSAFLNAVQDEQKRKDSFVILEKMKKITKAEPKMWGTNIIGFGTYHYKYDSGREGDWFLTGFSPRKQNLTLYIMSGFDRKEEDLARLGKHKSGKGCLYIKKLSDIDSAILDKLITGSVEDLRKKYG